MDYVLYAGVTIGDLHLDRLVDGIAFVICNSKTQYIITWIFSDKVLTKAIVDLIHLGNSSICVKIVEERKVETCIVLTNGSRLIFPKRVPMQR